MHIHPGTITKPKAPSNYNKSRELLYKEIAYEGVGGVWGNQRAQWSQCHCRAQRMGEEEVRTHRMEAERVPTGESHLLRGDTASPA